MDFTDDGEPLRGFRFKWRKTQHDSQSLAHAHDHVSDEFAAVLQDAESSDVNQCALPDSFGVGLHSPDPGLECAQDGHDMSEQYEPSVAFSSIVTPPERDVGGKSSASDDSSGISDLFIRGAKFSGIKMPWETPLMDQIFGEQHPTLKLSMPIDWGNSDLPASQFVSTGASEPIVPAKSRCQLP